MEIDNHTPFEVELTIGPGPSMEPCLAVVVKATYALPEAPGEPPRLADEQRPVLLEDVYHDGDPTRSLVLERDAVAFKPRADVALVGSAWAPGGHPVRQMDVMLRVGGLRRVLRVFGDRRWLFPSRLVMVPLMGEAEPFTRMPITWERAFGGMDRRTARLCAANLVGRGFLGKKSRETVDGALLPNVEDPARLIRSWDDEPAPAGLGFVSACWQPRAAHAGTERGLEAPHPLFGLAKDFEPAYYNAAAPELQVPGHLRGDEEVELVGLTPDGHRRFPLPGIRLGIDVAVGEPFVELEENEVVVEEVGDEGPAFEHGDVEGASGEDMEAEDLAGAAAERVLLEPVLDTLVLMPDEGVFTLTWRARYGLGPAATAEALVEALAPVRQITVAAS